MVFTLSRKNDLGTNLMTGAYKNSGLARVFQKAKEKIAFEDYSWYEPHNEPSVFIAAPLKDNQGTLTGVVVCKPDVSNINQVMQRRDGMGKTGEAYLVGSDMLMRSDSFLDPTGHSVEASFKNPTTGRIETDAARDALAGKTDIRTTIDYRGQPVLSAFTYLDFLGVRWALIVEKDTAEAFAMVATLRNSLLIIGGVVVLISVGIGVYFARSIRLPLSKTIGMITTTTSQLSSTVAQHERTATQQATMVNETNTTVTELGISSKQSSEQAANVSEMAQKASSLVDEGSHILKESVNAMNNLRDKVMSIANQILKLGEQTSQIGNIANLVKDIAGQTNMLALNAAVEAVRAGEHGKGFAVLAGEVRKLADQSKKSAEKANVLVTEVQKATNTTIMVTEEGTKTAEEVTRFVQKAGELFDTLAGTANSVYENAQQVLLNTKQQTDALKQIVEAMNGMNTGARETVTGIIQTKVSIQQLNEAAQNLKVII